MSPVIFHIDVNSAYLSWSALEKLKNGSSVDLRAIPSIIGGDEKSRRGIVLAKSIPAKKYGIHTAEPVASALRKCPSLVIEPPDHKLYRSCSHAMMELLSSFTPDLEQVSIDECYMDFTPIAHLYPSPEEAAALIRDRIYDELRFTVNIGIAPTKVLAKMASDFEKPGKVHTLYPEEIPVKMWPLPVSDLYMAGHRSAEKLAGFGIRTIGDLARTDPAFLTAHFKSHGRLMWEFANGIDPSPVLSEKHKAKGIGNSTTLREDITDPEEAGKVLLTLCESVSGRLRSAGQLAGTVTVEIKYHDFTKASHQARTLSPCNTTGELYELACTLFDKLWDGRPIRLLGVRSSRLVTEGEPVQLSIFDLPLNAGAEKETAAGTPSPEKLKHLDLALDSIRKKYGKDAVKRGRQLIDSSCISDSAPSAEAHRPYEFSHGNTE